MIRRSNEWGLEILPTINAVLILILFLHFYEGDVESIMYVLGAASLFGGKIRDRLVSSFVKKITQKAHFLLCVGLVSISSYIFVPKISKAITDRIEK